MAERRPVRILREDVARRIAAGEVIDRPAAILRELLDNAVDSGAKSINVEIADGGISLVKVSDDGSGMTRDDLENCANPHATSKIIDAEDLTRLSTLGFRGEALASIAAVSTLEISSGNMKMSMSNSKPRKIETAALFQDGKGTCVSSKDLFSDFPARRVFLKRPASETMMCKDIFVEKTLARPDIAFKLTVDGNIRLNLPANVSTKQRFASALEIKESSSLLYEFSTQGKEADGKNDWKFTLVIADPSIRRNDRRSIFVYVNGRRVQEYSLLQAIEYGCQGFFPNGTHPVASLFATVSPSLVDFNIHPAKKEVKFRDISALHHGVSSSISNFLKALTSASMKKDSNENSEEEIGIEGESEIGIGSRAQNTHDDAQEGILPAKQEFDDDLHENEKSERIEKNNSQRNFSFGSGSSKEAGASAQKSNIRSKFFSFDTSAEKQLSKTVFFSDEELDEKRSVADSAKKSEFRYIGCTMNTFILVEKKNTLYMIDQHAAHERIIFDKMMGGKDETNYPQPLLIPYTIETDDESESNYVESLLVKLGEIGFEGKKTGKTMFEFSTIPSRWKGTQKDLKDALLEEKTEPERIMYKIYATASCRKAVMQGMQIDDKTAEDIARQAFELPDPHCPHGRPIWFKLSKEQMFSNVRRTEN